MATNNSFKDNLLRVIAVIGLIAILLLGAWGIIQLAFRLPAFFGGFWTTRESLTVTVPSQAVHDQAFPVSWKHAGKSGEDSYAVTYSCAEGLAFAAPVPTGEYKLIPCATPFNFINASSSMQVIPVLAEGVSAATTSITVTSTNLEDGTVGVKGSKSLRITRAATSTQPVATTTKPATEKPATAKPSTSTSKPSTTYVPSGRTTNLYGYPDLAVQITSAPQSARVGGRVSLQFVVTNIGTNVAPAGWTFTATLPYNPVYVYPSVGQQALYPGDKIVYTLGYDVVPGFGGYYGGASATIEVDVNRFVPETNEYNNQATASYQVY